MDSGSLNLDFGEFIRSNEASLTEYINNNATLQQKLGRHNLNHSSPVIESLNGPQEPTHQISLTNGGTQLPEETTPTPSRSKTNGGSVASSHRMIALDDSPSIPHDIARYIDMPPDQRRRYTYNELNHPISLTSQILNACGKYLVGEQLTWAMGNLHALAEYGDLTVFDAVETNFERTNLVRNSAPRIGQVCPETRSFITPSIKRFRKRGRKQDLRKEIEYIFSCFDSLNEKGDIAKFPLLSIFEQEGAYNLACFKHGKGKESDAQKLARKIILPSLLISFAREDLVEYLIFKGYFTLNKILAFLLVAIIKEKNSKLRKSHTSFEADLFKSVKSRAKDHHKIHVRDIEGLTKPKGLTSKIITKFALYLDTINANIQTFHAHCFFPGDHKLSGHFVQTWAFTTYLKNLRKNCEAFVFFVLESDSCDQMAAHLYVLIGRKENKRIFCIDINKEEYRMEAEVLAESLDHYISCGTQTNPWNYETEAINLPDSKTDKKYFCADYALMCTEHFVLHNSTTFPESFTDLDYDDFRKRLSSILTPKK